MLAGARHILCANLRTVQLLLARDTMNTSLSLLSSRLLRNFGKKSGSTKKNKEVVGFEERMAAIAARNASQPVIPENEVTDPAPDHITDKTDDSTFSEKEVSKFTGTTSSNSNKARSEFSSKPASVIGSQPIMSSKPIPSKISDIQSFEDEITPFYPEDEKAAARLRRQKKEVPKPVKSVSIRVTKESEPEERNTKQLVATSDMHSDGLAVSGKTEQRTLAKFDDGRETGEWSDLPQIKLRAEDLENIDLEIEGSTLRLTKYLSRCGVASRRQAEQMLEQGLVRINGKKALANVMIDPNADKITIFTKKGEYFPLQDKTKVWSFYKPMGLICTHKDTHNRPTIFDYIKKAGLIKEDYFISVGRLDYNSEGLILLTNDGELARALELPLHKLERTYRVRVYGRFTDEKLASIRKGAVINGVKYGPFYCEVDSYQTRNTWLIVKMHQGKNREIRRIMQKNDLRVNRLKRISYGPYNLGNLDSGMVREEPIGDEIKRLMYLATRKKLEAVEQEKLTANQVKEEVVKKLEGRLLDPLPLLKKAKALTASQNDPRLNSQGSPHNMLL